MSIFGSLAAPDEDHEDGCAIYVENPPGSGCFDLSGKPCDCGMSSAPLIYEGSHVLPSDDDPRGGSVDLATIPDHITRDGRDDAPAGSRKDWLRLGVRSYPSRLQYEGEPYIAGGDATVILDRKQVEQIRDTLNWWLEAEARA